MSSKPYPKDDPLLQTLTKNDVDQIVELARHRIDIRKPIYEICVTAAGRADVSGGKAESSGGVYPVFSQLVCGG
jgi:hypothetical protein